MPNPHFERQEMGFAVAACVSLVSFFFSPHLFSALTFMTHNSFSVQPFAIKTPKRKQCTFQSLQSNYHHICNQDKQAQRNLHANTTKSPGVLLSILLLR